LPHDNSPGIVVFTATCWRKPLKAKNMPAGEAPLTAADCYRFVLSNPNVNVCITGPSSAHQMGKNLAALAGGPCPTRRWPASSASAIISIESKGHGLNELRCVAACDP
jgi:hypothetical protein